jgi:hypothetical protein
MLLVYFHYSLLVQLLLHLLSLAASEQLSHVYYYVLYVVRHLKRLEISSSQYRYQVLRIK